MLTHLQSEVDARVIVYAPSRKEVDQLSGRLSCPAYYSDSGNDEEKDKAFQLWRQGSSKVIVATSAFGMGIDYPHVRVVIHMGAPRDMISFVQEVGRLGRDGRGGTSRVVLPYGWQSSAAESLMDRDFQKLPELAMQLYLGRCRCLAAVLSRFQDGRQKMQYCSGEDATRWCSLCQRFGLFRHTEEKDHTVYWDQTDKTAQEEPNENQETSFDISDESISSEEGDETPNELSQGHERLRLHRRDEERGRDQYVQRLRGLQGRCMICSMLGGGGGQGDWHDLTVCRRPEKQRFFAAKQRAIERGKVCGGWLKAYVACYNCGNPQEVCESQGKPGCEFRDMVLPAAWALFGMRNRWGRSLQEISGASERTCSNEEKWMDWVGEECELYGMRASEAARMADWVMGKMLEGRCSVEG